MWITLLSNNVRHSAWDSQIEALQQAEILMNHGLIKITPKHRARGIGLKDFVEFDHTVQCENGDYYV